MRARFSLRPVFWLATTVAAVVMACGSPPPPPSTHKDAGTSGTACASAADCPSGDLCVNDFCVVNSCDPAADAGNTCPDGYTCDALSAQCQPLDGGTTSGNDGGNTTGGCQSKYDCTAGDICSGGTCVAPSGSTCVSNDQCPAGQICNFSKQCEAGCASNQDCAAPQICNQSTLNCAACSSTNPCPNGQICAAGACTSGQSCMKYSDCTMGLVCASGSCSNCTSDNDCTVYGTGYTCLASGSCGMATCTDTQCQMQYGARAYCDTSTMTCQEYQCASDSDCVSPQTCDLTSHTCASGSTGTDGGLPGLDGGGGGLPGLDGGGFPGGGGGSCMSNSDCAANATCVNVIFASSCAQNCTTAADCPSGQPCCMYSGSPTGNVCSSLGMCL